MSRRRHSLFDAIASNRREGQEPQVRVPDWWNAPKRRDARSAATGEDERAPRSGPSSNWLAQPYRVAMPRALWLIAIAALAGIVVLAYQMGRGSHGGALPDQTDARSAERLADARRQEVNPLLLSQVRRVNEAGDSAAPAGEPTDGGVRVPGLNYFCLETMPARYEAEAKRAAGFLGRNGVDAAIVPVHNSRIQLIALRGFDKSALGGSQAREYENLLRSLGRAWKLEHQGWSDWSDLYAAKYTGR
jgi:hypothetical protein